MACIAAPAARDSPAIGVLEVVFENADHNAKNPHEVVGGHGLKVGFRSRSEVGFMSDVGNWRYFATCT